MRTGMTSYLTMPVVPTVLGFDPRLQFVHEDDAIEVTRRVVLQRSRGTYNIAGDGVVLLSQAIRMMNRMMVPLPSAVLPFAGRSLARGAWADFSRDQIRYLTYGRALDTSAAANDLGFQARFSSEQALESLALAVRAHG
jgi:UDP-glucose 4-epimerase